MSDHESQAVLDALIALLRPAISHDTVPGSHERMFRKALALIDQRITCEQLTPEFIAREVGISMRSLYRIFAKHGGDCPVHPQPRASTSAPSTCATRRWTRRCLVAGVCLGVLGFELFQHCIQGAIWGNAWGYRRQHAN
jgi:AraC family transcriptional activator of tynA and feaB